MRLRSFTSKRTSSGISSFNVNVQSTYASLPLNRGLAKFCGAMNFNHILSYTKILKTLQVKSREAAEKIMKEAADRLIILCMEESESIDVYPDGTQIACVAVSLDSTWQKRGDSSKHGVIFLISVDTGEVLDY